MKPFALIAIVGAVPILPAEANPPSIHDDFNSLNWGIWCPCQINMAKSPVKFTPKPGVPGDHFATITADATSLGGNVCRQKAPDLECRPPVTSSDYTLYGFETKSAPGPEIAPDRPEPLGPSLLPRLKAVEDNALSTFEFKALADPYCTKDVMDRVNSANEEGLCIQRQELRLQEDHTHEAQIPYAYSFRIRMPSHIEDRTNSIRWVAAQWKDEPVSSKYATQYGSDWAPSPFLAQRFDDGVLHVTIQDEDCRCLIASAPLPDGSSPPWQDGPAQYCESTKPDAADHEACKADLQVKYGTSPILLSPLGQWVEMKYLLRLTAATEPTIEVYQNGRFIVRVTGKIGYDPPADNKSITKFKIGQYRDYMPSVDSMDVDWVRIDPIAN